MKMIWNISGLTTVLKIFFGFYKVNIDIDFQKVGIGLMNQQN